MGLLKKVSRKLAHNSKMWELGEQLEEHSSSLEELAELSEKLSESEERNYGILKQAEEERQQLISIFEGIDQPILVCRRDDKKLLYYNDALEKVTEEVAEGKTCHEALYGFLAPCPDCPVNVESDECGQAGMCTCDKYSEKIGRWYHVIHKEISWPNNPTHPAIFSLLIDITERKEASVLLQKERDLAQDYLNIVGVIVVAIDEDQNVTLINKKGAEILGYEIKEVIGKNWFETFLPISTRDVVQEVFDRLMKGSIKLVEHFENDIITKSGSLRRILWHNTTITSDGGTLVGTLSSGEDVTELRDAEIAYVTVVENSLQGLVILTPERVIFCNKAFETIVGMTRVEIYERPVTEWKALMPPEEADKATSLMAERMMGKDVLQRYTIHLNVDGKEKTLEIFSSAIKHMGASAVQVAVLDITPDE